MKLVLDAISRVLQVAITLLFAVLIVPVTMQIVSRYTGLVPRYIWTEEIARFCFIWIIMIGAMIATREDSHFDVDLLPEPRTPAGRGFAKLIVHVAMLAMALAFIWYGKEFADEGAMQSSEIADLPMLAIYIAWPLAGVVWTLFLGEKIVEDVRLIRSVGH
jgi:TRAP-type C4-dicarboxylate transport system permease small subunit